MAHHKCTISLSIVVGCEVNFLLIKVLYQLLGGISFLVGHRKTNIIGILDVRISPKQLATQLNTRDEAK